VTTFSVPLPTGTVHVNAVPWAEVWIDGKRVGETPIGNLSIAIGPHELVFRHPELGEKTVLTVVKPGAPTMIATDLRSR
jgi:eukaryotic-like serine/threonine-protein kinase